MKVASTSHALVAQAGANAAVIRAKLGRVKLPPGFRIDLYAVVPGARHMAIAPSTDLLFVGTRKARRMGRDEARRRRGGRGRSDCYPGRNSC
jgi:hypothetical protein